MAGRFTPLRFFLLMGLLAFIAFGSVAFFTQRAAHGRSPEARAAYESGWQAGTETAPDAKMPAAWEMNELAEKFLQREETKKVEPMAWKSAFGRGYEVGFKKSHPGR